MCETKKYKFYTLKACFAVIFCLRGLFFEKFHNNRIHRQPVCKFGIIYTKRVSRFKNGKLFCDSHDGLGYCHVK